MLPWGEMMRAALHAGVSVEAFWALSLREWRWLAGGADDGGLPRGGLAVLMTQFPDKDEENGRV